MREEPVRRKLALIVLSVISVPFALALAVSFIFPIPIYYRETPDHSLAAVLVELQQGSLYWFASYPPADPDRSIRPIVEKRIFGIIWCQISDHYKDHHLPDGTWRFTPAAEKYEWAIPVWPLFLAVAAYPTITLFRRLEAALATQPGHCRCGYDLTANTSGICPECGTPVPSQEPGTKQETT
jgi:hypothetical protein